MIKCSIHLDHWVPSAHENFSTIECDDFAQLKTKIDNILKTIRIIDNQDIAEIQIDMNLNGIEPDLHSIEWNHFIEFISSHHEPVLKFNLSQKNASVQKLLDFSYWKAVEKWHESQLKRQSNTMSQRMSNSPFMQSLVLESTVSSNRMNVARVPLVQDIVQPVQERAIYLPKLGAQRTVNSYAVDPLYSGFSKIIHDCCGANETVNLLETIEACIGEQGLLHIFNQLSVEPIKSHLPAFIHVFLSSSNAIDKFLPYLIRPEGQHLIQLMSELPDALFVHWIKWIELQETIPNLKKSIHKIHQFYQLLQKYNVRIPADLAQDNGNFSERVDVLTRLLEPTHPMWNGRKHYYTVQAPKLLALPISVLNQLEHVLNQSKCKWIRPEMLMDGFHIIEMDPERPAPSHLAGFYTYAAQFMQDKRDGAFSQIEELVKEPLSNELEWQLAAWCATLSSQPAKTVFEKLKIDLNPDVIVDLYAIPPEKRMSVQDLDAMLQLEIDYGVLFKTYAYLFKSQSAAKAIWSLVFSKPLDAWKANYLKTLSEAFAPNTVFKIFLLSIAENEGQIAQLAIIFENLSADNQAQLIEILSSWDVFSGELTIVQVEQVLSSRKNDEQTFKTHCPGVNFNYFKSSLDYGKVIESLVKLLDDVRGSFECLLSPDTQVGLGYSIASFMKKDIKKALSEQIEKVDSLNTMLMGLKGADNKDEQLQNFLANLQDIDGFFKEFIEMEAGKVINSMIAFSYFSISSNDSMQVFFASLYDKYDQIKSTIGAYLNKDKIGLIANAIEDESLLQKFIELDLLTEFNDKIKQFADQKILVADASEQKDAIFKSLALYIGRLPLTLDGFKEFFVRCEGLNKKIETAPEFEEKCRENDLEPVLIWDLLAKRIQTKDGIASVSFWKTSDELLDCLIQNKSRFTATGATSFLRIYEALLQCSDVFPKTIEHEHWNLCLEQLQEFIQDDKILKHPMFGFVLKDSISYVLEKGKKYNFEENVKLYTAIGQKNPELMQTLQGLLAKATPENQELLYAVLEKTRLIFENPNGLDGQQVLIRILADNDLVSNLNKINEILGWLLTHDNFVWSGVLAEDKEWDFNQLWALYNTFKKTSAPWSNAYQHMFPLKPQTWYIEPNAQQHEVHVEAEVAPSKKPRNVTRWLQKRTSEMWAKVTSAVSSGQQPQDDAHAAQIKHSEEKAASFWTIFKNYPYPSVAQMTKWLGKEVTAFEADIQWFDKGDTQKVVSYQDEDINRWISEVTCYNLKSWSGSESVILKGRLMHVFEQMNCLMPESRQSLKHQFNDLKLKIQLEPSNIALQNEFIATLCTAYYKVVGKVPYPTQILALLLNLRLDDKNLVYEIDTGEGKGVTIGLLALLKFARQENNTVLVRTTTPDLVKQDLYEKKNAHFFNLFDVPSHILDQKTENKDFKQGGIYYSAGRDFDVFSERVSLAGQSIDFSMDVIIDELDSYLFDQNTVIKLTEENKELSNFLWIYPQINAYPMMEGDNVQALKQYLIECNATSPERIEQIQQLQDEQWRQWLMMSQRVKNLIENQNFVVRFNKKQDMYEAIPYDNGELKEGFCIGDSLSSGLQQFLHAHLSQDGGQFAIVPETRLVSYLDTLNFKNVSSLVGLSGSIGGLPEVWEYQEAINANSARIGRFNPENITKHPTLVAVDDEDMHQQISNLAKRLDQPLLILTDDIEEAQQIYASLKANPMANKKIKLLTGVEDESERRQWLHGHEGDFAKDKNAVTIATKVCSRGIDLTPEVKENVFVLEVGIGGIRDSKQKIGRTGRGGEEGTYQRIVNLKAIERQWRSAFNFDKLPLTKDTLPTYIHKIQSYISAQNHQKRMNLRLNDWAKKHVVQYLKDLGKQDPDHFQTNFVDYYQHIHTWFMELPKEGLSTEQMIAESMKIWHKVEALLKIRGKSSLTKRENNLEQILKDDQNHVHLLVTIDTERYLARKESGTSLSTASLTESEENFIPDEVCREELDDIYEHVSFDGSETASTEQSDKFLNVNNLKTLSKRLQKCEPEMSTIKTLFTYIFFFIPDIFQWLNPAATLTQQYLDSAWKTFKEDPSPRNWKDFYRLLLSAKKLHQQQSEQSIWHIDYWFDVFNKLRPWVEFSKHIERELEHLDFTREVNQTFNLSIFAEIKSEIEKQNVDVLDNRPKGLIDRFMQSFQPLFRKDLEDLTEKYNAFMTTPSAENLNELYQQLHKVQKFHEESQEWRSWRMDYWWYWQSRMEPWMELAHKLPKILEDKETPAFKAWKGKQKDISYFQLFYREYLICKEQLRSRDRRYAFWFWGQENPLSKLNNEYEAKVSEAQYSREIRKYEIDEVARFFPKEAMVNFNLFQQGTKVEENHEKQQTMYLRVLDVMKHMFKPTLDTHFSLDLSSHRLELFHDELEKWRTRPELIADLNQRQ